MLCETMLPEKNRLKSSKDIDKVFRQGKSSRSGFLFLKYAPNGLDVNRIAFSVGLKYSKSAVKRNRAKRLLRVAASNVIDKLRSGHDVVIYLKDATPEQIEDAPLEKMIKEAFQKANLFEN